MPFYKWYLLVVPAGNSECAENKLTMLTKNIRW
jgi:hypothetical protein